MFWTVSVPFAFHSLRPLVSRRTATTTFVFAHVCWQLRDTRTLAMDVECLLPSSLRERFCTWGPGHPLTFGFVLVDCRGLLVSPCPPYIFMLGLGWVSCSTSLCHMFPTEIARRSRCFLQVLALCAQNDNFTNYFIYDNEFFTEGCLSFSVGLFSGEPSSDT